jgi:transcriptional regulator with XRE-family HTH domain
MARPPLPVGTLAEKLKALRARSGKSLQQVADAVDVSKAYVWELESGEKGINPTIDVLTRLADFYRVTVAYLTNEKPDPATPDEAMRLWRNLNDLTDRERDLVADVIDSLKRRRDGP